MQKLVSRIGSVFLVCGLLFLAGAGFAAWRTSVFLRRAAAVEGTVVDLVASRSEDSDGNRTTVYRPVVQYSPEGGEARTFTGSVASAPPAYAIGERVSVLYDPAQPGDVRLSGTFSLWGLPIILSGFGVVFAAIGGVVLALRGRGRRREAELRLHGRRVQAKLQSVERNRGLEVNGTNPWRIVCQWQDPATGLLHLLKSENLWFDPTPYLQGEHLTAFVDPRDPRRHHLDVSFLPKLAA